MSTDVHVTIALEVLDELQTQLRDLARSGPRLGHVLAHKPLSNPYWRALIPHSMHRGYFRTADGEARRIMFSWSAVPDPYLGWILGQRLSEDELDRVNKGGASEEARSALARYQSLAATATKCLSCLGFLPARAEFRHLILAMYEMASGMHPVLAAPREITCGGMRTEVFVESAVWYSELQPDLTTGTAAALRTWLLMARSRTAASELPEAVPSREAARPTQPILDEVAIGILRSLAQSPTVQRLNEIAVSVRRNRKTVGTRLDALLAAGLVHRTKGGRSPLGITSEGWAVLERMPRP